MAPINFETIQNTRIRRLLDENSDTWYFSVVDIVSVASGSADARNYWKVLKNRLKKDQHELVAKCNQLKMPSSDGKMYLTDVADRKTLEKIIHIVDAGAVSPFRLWFDRVESVAGLDGNAIQPDTEMKLMIDAYQTPDNIVVEAMVGGTRPEDLSISLDHKTLTIRGKVLGLGPVSSDKKITGEISWGSYSRIVPLPALVDIDRAEVSFSRGMLSIKLPKINLARAKEIKVR